MELRQLAFAALTLGVCGCASTSLKQTWKSPTHTGGPVQKIAVLAVDERHQFRASVESHFVFQMDQRGQGAFMTHDLMTLPAIKEDKAAAAAKLGQQGADTLLLVRLASSSSSFGEVRATHSAYTPVIGGYETGNWYDYYTVAFMDMSAVWGHSKRETCLETILFDLKTEQRIWSGVTETVLKEEADRIEALSDLVTKVLNALRKDGLIH